MRLFVAIPIPKNININLPFLREFSSFRPTSREYHLTLSFLGDKNPKEVVPYFKQHFKNKPPLGIKLQGLSGFPSPKHARVIFIRAIPSYNIMEGWKYEKNDILHLTLGRARPPIDISQNPYKEHYFGEFVADKVFLYNSNLKTKKYEIVEEVKLS